MRTTLLFLLCNAFASMSLAQANFIGWSDTTFLAWQDFKGPVPKGASLVAYTYSAIKMNYEAGAAKQYTVKVMAAFDPAKSWKVETKVTEGLLKHEQGHFDITEIFARMFVKQLKDLKGTPENKFGEKINALLKKIWSDQVNFQSLYDAETDHSKNAAKQLEWNEKIKTMLDKYSAYTQHEIVVQL